MPRDLCQNDSPAVFLDYLLGIWQLDESEGLIKVFKEGSIVSILHNHSQP